jgi:hypothetical protein
MDFDVGRESEKIFLFFTLSHPTFATLHVGEPNNISTNIARENFLLTTENFSLSAGFCLWKHRTFDRRFVNAFWRTIENEFCSLGMREEEKVSKQLHDLFTPS